MLKGKTTALDDLTDLEEAIYEIIKKVLNKNVIFQINSDLIEFCCQKVKLPEYKVYQILFSLLRRKFIVPGSSLTKEQILENQNRALIFKQIQEKPGMHIRELCSILGKTSGVIRAHLEILENFDYIRRKTYDNPKLTLLFLKDYPEVYDDYFLIIKNENDQRIIQLLINKLSTISELSTQMGVHHSTIQYHLEKLERLNLIVSVQTDQNSKYTFNRAKLDTFTKFLDEIIPAHS